MTYMLDTNICIYAMKKKPEKVLHRFREELDGGLCISSITLAELEYGMKHSSDPVTNNVREFERVPDLEIENWAE